MHKAANTVHKAANTVHKAANTVHKAANTVCKEASSLASRKSRELQAASSRNGYHHLCNHQRQAAEKEHEQLPRGFVEAKVEVVGLILAGIEPRPAPTSVAKHANPNSTSGAADILPPSSTLISSTLLPSPPFSSLASNSSFLLPCFHLLLSPTLLPSPPFSPPSQYPPPRPYSLPPITPLPLHRHLDLFLASAPDDSDGSYRWRRRLKQ
jgi:hypothetical protein